MRTVTKEQRHQHYMAMAEEAQLHHIKEAGPELFEALKELYEVAEVSSEDDPGFRTMAKVEALIEKLNNPPRRKPRCSQ